MPASPPAAAGGPRPGPSGPRPGPGAGPADLILHNAEVWTADPGNPTAEAVAIGGERILAVGSADQVRAHAGPGTRSVDLGGAFVMPGLNDSHIHVASLADALPDVDLMRARRIADVVGLIGARVAGSEPGAWVRARYSWHETLLAESRLPTRHDLDPVSPGNPVYIPRGGHVATVNSMALKLAGITADTPDPPGGIIVRDAAGEPTGVLIEHAARSLVSRLLPPRSREESVRLLGEQMAVLHRWGITSVTDPALFPDQLQTHLDLWRTGTLTMRTHLLRRVPTLAQVHEVSDAYPVGYGDSMLRFDGLKYVADGGIEGACLREPFQLVPGEQDDPDYRGLLLTPPGGIDELRELYLAAAGAGYTVLTHVTGDGCLDAVLEVLAEVRRAAPIDELRWAIHGVFLPDDRALETIRRLGLHVTLQSLPYLLGMQEVKWWGRERAEYSVPMRRFLDHGLPVGGGSDAGASVANPWECIGWMVTRQTLHGPVLGPQWAIEPEEALRLYTTGSAATQFAERQVGSLEAGKLADLVVASANPLRVPPSEIKAISAEATIVSGRVVHDAGGLLS